ncbi:MAG: hypothetical protein ABJN69_12335 [Hellea sp.]
MTSKLNDNEYDENCVFNRILAAKPKTPDTNPLTPLERVFGTAKASPKNLSVADFLPIY